MFTFGTGLTLDAYEYREFPEIDGVKRVTTDRLVLIQVDKDESVRKISAELHGAPFGGLYFLIDSGDFKIYIGESSDVKDRVGQHAKKSPIASFDFDRVIVIWDGRSIDTSHFNDTSMRKALEYESIKAFREYSNYETQNTQGKSPDLNVYQRASIDKFKVELFYLLYKFHLITELPSETILSQRLTQNEIRKLLTRNNFQVENIHGGDKIVKCKDAVIFYRAGSLKPLGWQVTMRDTFLDEMFSGKEGVYFLLSRTEPYLIPASVLKENLEGEKDGLTLDFFINEKEKKLRCHDVSLDISRYRIS